MRRMISLCLCLCFVVPFFVSTIQATAKEAAAASNNMFLLSTDTGINPGIYVQYIAVRYEDSSGMTRSEFIFPQNGSIQDSYRLASNVHSVDGRLDIVETATHYSPIPMEEKECLQTYSHDDFLFVPHYTLKKVLSVDIYQNYDENSKADLKGWSCTGLSIFEVKTLYGLKMYGYYSSDYFVEFDGKLLWSMPDDKGSYDFAFSHSDQIYTLSADNNPGYKYMNMKKQNESYSTQQSQEFMFEINIADVYQSGIEALATPVADNQPPLCELPIMEFLSLQVSYLDTIGVQRTVKMPVITSCISWAVENGFLNYSSKLAGIAQQGENLVFAGRLPGFSSLVDYQLSYDLDADKLSKISRAGDIAINGKPYKDPKEPFIDRDKYADIHVDRMFLTSLKIYCTDGNAADNVEYTGSDGALTFGISANPSYFYAAGSAYGDALSVGSPKRVQMLKYEKDAITEPVFDLKNRYIVEIETDNVSFADTTSEVQAVFYYRSTSGTNSTTNPFYISDAAREYYGYWPGTKGDYAYAYATSAGTKMDFFLDVEEVAQFNGVDFYMDSTGNDDWQIKSIRIYKPEYIGKRLVRWEDHSCTSNSTDRIYYRPFDDSMPMRFYGVAGDDPIYLNGQSGDNAKKHVDFDERSQEKPSEDVDWTDSRYSMTYKEALADFGFTRVRATYEVQVQVAGNEYASVENGDCGSNNLFFFQLNFQNGSSGFVLANQQLSSDGFRAGVKETFTIQTNQDYGELDSIRILPFDLDDDKERDIFDKLKIDTVTVVKKSNSSLSRTWKAENVGWIEIDYSDQGAANSLNGKQGRSYDQIARDFPITYKGFSHKLLFTVTTGPYKERFTDSGNISDPQLEGSVTATIYYNDGTPGVKEQPIDLVREIYDYNEQNPRINEETGKALIDPTYMMRENHQDRFFVTIDNVKKVTGIRLEVRGSVATTWNINGISVYLVDEDGALKINTNGEYQQHYDDQIEAVTSSALDSYSLFVTNDGSEQKQIIDFLDNTIDVDTSEEEWKTVITREPINRNDNMNLYVHMSPGAGYSDIQHYELKGSINYKLREREVTSLVEINNLKKAPSGDMFYATDIYAANLDYVSTLKLDINSPDPALAYVDYAVIQHVRSGVVINTYFIDYGDQAISELGLVGHPSGGEGHLNTQMQKVQLFFAQNTKNAELSEEKTDIAVAIRYTTTNDVTNTEYTSPYIFITDPHQTDSDLIKYPTIKPGMIAELNFHEDFVKEITGIQVVAVGNLEATIASATAATYSRLAGEFELDKWYNFSDQHELSHSPAIFTPTDTNVVPVEIDMKTALSTDTFGTGTTAPIRMIISYTNMQNSVTRSLTIPDINKYLVSGTFNSEDTATIRFFMKDLGQIRSITLEPHADSAYNTAMWGLETIGVKLTRSGKQELIQRSFTGTDGLISEGDPKVISMMNISLTTLTSFFNSKVQVQNAINSDSDGRSSILLYSGDTATIAVTLDGSLPGYGFTVAAELSRDGATTKVNCIERNNNKIVVSPPKNTSGTDDVYLITITSDENPKVQAVVEIHVESEPEPTPEPKPEPEPQTDEGETTT